MPTVITRRAREILSGTAVACAGPWLRIAGELPARVFAEVKRALEAGGGLWDRSEQAYLFPGEARDALTAILAGNRVTSAKEAAQWFPTPPDVVAELIAWAHLSWDGLEVMEPEAGSGAIARAAAEAGCPVDCVELHPGRAAQLEAAGKFRTVTCADFLTVPPLQAYDRVIMNPPFGDLADVRHVLHALEFLRPGGRLVSVLGAGVTFRKDKGSALVRGIADMIEPLPPRSFTMSGTDADAVIAVITASGPVPPQNADGTPVRVTTDHDIPDVPYFRPRTAPHGTYIRRDAWQNCDRVFRFAGDCAACGAPTWRHDDGDDDARGPFGYNGGQPLHAEHLRHVLGDAVPDDIEIPRCMACWEDGPKTDLAIERAVEQVHAASRARGQEWAGQAAAAETAGAALPAMPPRRPWPAPAGTGPARQDALW